MRFHFHQWSTWFPGTRVETFEGMNTSRIEENLWVRECSHCPKRQYRPRAGIRWIAQESFKEA